MFHVSMARQSHGKSWEVRCHLMVSDFSSRAFYTGGEESEGGEAGMWKVAHQQEVPGKFLVHRTSETGLGAGHCCPTGSSWEVSRPSVGRSEFPQALPLP